jgi:surfeit locus 1 family protein
MKCKLVPLIAYLCLLPLLLTLGIWQLNRAEEKRAILDLQSQRQGSEVLELSASLSENLESLLYKPVSAVGHYDSSHQYLLDNQVSKGRAGYSVLTPFRSTENGKAVLVNRGWIPLGKSRAELPDIRVALNKIKLTGRINRFPRVGLRLAGSELPAKGWPAVVQVIDVKVLSQQLGYSLVDFQIELDKFAANGFAREWQESVVMTPEKHTAYAVQWFLLAITLTVLFIKYGFKNNEQPEN